MPHPATASSRPPRSPYGLLALGILAVGTGSIFARLAEAPALAISFWRCALAAGVLGLVHARALARELPALSRADVASGLLAGLFLALHFAAWITSLELTSVSASVVLVNTHLLWVGLLTPLATRDRVDRRTAAGLAACFAGTLVLASGDASGEGEALLGDGLALAGGLAAAFYLLAGRRLRGRLSLGAYTTLCYGAAAVLLAPLALAAGQPLAGFSAETWAWIAACGLVPQLVGHTAFNWALRWVPAALVALSLTGEPLVATLLAWVFLDEAPTGAVVLGGATVLAGIAIAASRGSREPQGSSSS